MFKVGDIAYCPIARCTTRISAIQRDEYPPSCYIETTGTPGIRFQSWVKDIDVIQLTPLDRLLLLGIKHV